MRPRPGKDGSGSDKHMRLLTQIGRRNRTFPVPRLPGAGSSLVIEMQLVRSVLQLVAELRVRDRNQGVGPLRKRPAK
jgi:hypothetical protein